MQLEIEKLVYGGDGLARLPADEHGRGKTVFLPFVLPGEKIEASVVESRPGFVRAQLENVITPSPERVEPGCSYFGHCGGCHYQHIDYAAQLRHKAEILRETLRRTAKFELQHDIELHSAEPWGYRNRTRMHVRHQPEFALGYFRYNSHDLLAGGELSYQLAADQSGDCRGLEAWPRRRNPRICFMAFSSSPTTTTATSAGSLYSSRQRCRKIASHSPPRCMTALPQVAGVVVFATSTVEDESRQRSPLTSTHAEPSQPIGGDSLLYHAVEHDYRVSGGSFFQTNRHLIDQLVKVVVGHHTGRAALDLYAGAGLFTHHLARNFDQVMAVEASPHSFADLRHNVPPNVKCMRSTTEAFLAERAAKLAPDRIVVDPPRPGLGEKAAKALGRMSASHVTYVSCDPATLSRDLRVLLESGYRVEQTHLVDMFPQTYHMETVLHLAR